MDDSSVQLAGLAGTRGHTPQDQREVSVPGLLVGWGSQAGLLLAVRVLVPPAPSLPSYHTLPCAAQRALL